jgi:outer membrane protein
MSSIRRLSILAILACLFASQPGVAQQYDYEQWLSGAMATRAGDGEEWRFNFAAGAGLGPEYIGADDYEAKSLPLIDIEWRGAYFLSTQRGMGLNLIRQRATRAGPRITYDLGRDSQDSNQTKGLQDVDKSIEVGLFAQHFTGAWRLQADVRQGLNGHEGLIGSLDAAVGGAIAENVSLIVGGNTHYADASYLDAFFGVPAGSVTATRSAFSAESGFRDVGGYATVVVAATDNIYVSFDLRATLLMGSAADSPLSVSDDQYFVGTMVGYRF